MKCFIINYNRLTLMKNMADYLHDAGLEVYIIDNNSTYEPLLDYYKTTKYNVIRMNDNYEYKVFWTQDIYNKLNMNERYILTDSDLDLSNIPNDFLQILEDGLNKYPQFDKCGFSLKIDDLPDTDIHNEIRDWEHRNWKKQLDEMYYDAEIDTTFALYKVNKHSYNGIRTNVPYSAKHIPWYYTNNDDLPEDEKYYFNSIKRLSTFWTDKMFKNKTNIISNTGDNNFYNFSYDISINKLHISSKIDVDAIVSILKMNGELIFSAVSNFKINSRFWYVAGVDLYEINNIKIEIKDFKGQILHKEYMVLNPEINKTKNWKININI